MLTLYRRHIKSCTQGYSQNFRVFQPRTKKEDAKDCSCPIQAEGMLTYEGYLTNRSTRTNQWDDAIKIVQTWEDWGQTTEPDKTDPTNPTIEYAVDSFLSSRGSNVDETTMNNFNVLLKKRLLPY